jgi:hypothetical protein
MEKRRHEEESSAGVVVSRIIEIAPETVATIKERGGTWGVYQNLNFDSSKRGHVQFLRYGEGCTFLELPARLPDTNTAINHAYVLVHRVNAEELPDDGKLEVP